MAFPATLTLVTVTIQADLPPSGGNAPGWVDFTASQPLLGTTIVPAFTRRAWLDTTGADTIQLPATNDPQWSPIGWAYIVTGYIGGKAITGTLQLDHQSASANLSALLQVDGAATAGQSYLLVSQRSVAGGVAALDADGDVTNAAGAKITGGGGGGAAPSGTVVSGTSFGTSTTAGAATAYSRGDHSHGTPAAPTAASVGALATTGGTITGNLTVADAASATKAYRLKTSGGSLDFDAAGTDLFASVFTVADFSGAQRTYLRLESGAQLAHAVGRWIIAAGAFDGTGVADLDPSTGVAAIGSKNSLANLRICGFQNSAGAPSAGTWTTSDIVIDSNGQLWRCTAGGTPGTWTSAISVHTAAADPHPQYTSIYYWNGSSYDIVNAAAVYVGGTGPASPVNGDVWFP